MKKLALTLVIVLALGMSAFAEGGLFHYNSSDARIKAWQNSINGAISNDTGEDMTIEDRPAGWGNHGEYRIMDTSSSRNFFKVKASAVASMK